jgi:hypothetical protein
MLTKDDLKLQQARQAGSFFGKPLGAAGGISKAHLMDMMDLTALAWGMGHSQVSKVYAALAA